MTRPTRRGFVAGCSAAIAGMAGARFPSLAFADPDVDINNEVLVVVFLRGGMDGLNMVVPISGADRGYYEIARPNIAVPLAGADDGRDHHDRQHPRKARADPGARRRRRADEPRLGHHRHGGAERRKL